MTTCFVTCLCRSGRVSGPGSPFFILEPDLALDGVVGLIRLYTVEDGVFLVSSCFSCWIASWRRPRRPPPCRPARRTAAASRPADAASLTPSLIPDRRRVDRNVAHADHLAQHPPPGRAGTWRLGLIRSDRSRLPSSGSDSQAATIMTRPSDMDHDVAWLLDDCRNDPRRRDHLHRHRVCQLLAGRLVSVRWLRGRGARRAPWRPAPAPRRAVRLNLTL